MANVYTENVLAMHREEIFGVKNCLGLTWQCLFKDFMIIEAICDNCNNLTDEDVDCLYNKITNINN